MLVALSALAGCGPVSGTSVEPDSGPPADAAAEPEDGGAAAEANGAQETSPGQGGPEDVELIGGDAAGRQPASASAGQDDEVVNITFDDLICNMQADIVFRPWMLTDRAQQLDGRRIRVAGFMLPHLQREGITEFVLLRNVECKFGPGGQADHLIQVRLQEGVTASYKGDRPLEVVGRLKINPFQGPDGNTWCIYDMDGELVEWQRR